MRARGDGKRQDKFESKKIQIQKADPMHLFLRIPRSHWHNAVDLDGTTGRCRQLELLWDNNSVSTVLNNIDTVLRTV